MHSAMGYVVVGLAALGFVLALGALLSRSRLLDRLMYGCFALGVLVQIPALITGVTDNASLAAAAVVAPYNFFVGSSLFTLACVLVVWRGANPLVVWDSSRWLVYQAAALGHLLLSVALVWLGLQSRGGLG